ncbi:MAG TPA: Crp/Fnr family transcriptional regulator [Gammaproteobacteria bacterium]
MPENRDKSLEGLRGHYLFAALTDEQWDEIVAHTHVRRLAASEHLFERGERARAFFLLQEGMMKLYRVSAEGHEKIMRLIRPGMTFAESVMFMDDPRYPVHAQAVEPSTLLAIESAAYLEILRESFDTCRTVLATMTQRIQAHWDEIEALTLQNSRYRVVTYLLSLLPDQDLEEARVMLPSRKALIAAQLAATPETLSRILHGLMDEGLIEMRDYEVHIPSVSALRATVE